MNFDIHPIKRIFTSLSPVSVEKKGCDPKVINPTFGAVALCNELPGFTPATDTAFTSRLEILPHTAIFYPDDETKADLLAQGVDPGRLHPAKPKDEILAGIREEAPAILRMLVEDYIDLRDRHKLRPVESRNSRILKANYRAANDLVQQFFSEYLIRDPAGFITNDRLEALYKDFTGETKPQMRKVRKEITERWVEVQSDSKRVTEGTGSVAKRGLKGVRERRDGEKPDGLLRCYDTSANSTPGWKNSVFPFTDTKTPEKRNNVTDTGEYDARPF